MVEREMFMEDLAARTRTRVHHHGDTGAGISPTRPITLIIPTAAGGGNDGVGRVVADRMSHTLGQQLVVENRSGASGTIATKALARSAPDGYTLGISNSGTMGMGPSLFPNAGYDPRKDFALIGPIAASPMVLVVANECRCTRSQS